MAKAINSVARVVGAVASVVALIPGPWQPIAAAVAVTAGIVAKLTAQKPKKEGASTDFTLDGNSPIPYAMGRTFTAGRPVHRDTWGTDNQYQGFISVISGGGPIQSLDTFIIDNQAQGLGADGAATGSYSGWMWCKTQLGNTPEANALTAPSATGTMPGWGAAHKLSGLAADMWVLKADIKNGKKYANGIPKRGWVGKMVKCYDPRKDSTYPGGSGAHRIDNEKTWEFTENPWLHELTWEIGRRCANAAGQIGSAFAGSLLFLGAGMPAHAIDLPSYVYAANIADQNNWKISGIVYSNEEKWAVSKTIAMAGGGEPIKLAGKISAFINSPKVSAETITEADLIGPVSIPTSPSFQNRINRIIPKYLSETHGWEMVDGAPIGVEDWKDQDRGQWRTESQPYRLVSSVTQAAQLALYQIADSRERNGIVLALKPHWKGYGPGSCLTLNLPAFGLHNQKCVVIDRQEDAGERIIIMTFRTEDDNKHALALDATGTPPPGVNLVPTDTSNVAAPTSGAWNAEGSALVNNGSQVPAILITGATNNPIADQVIFEYRKSGGTDDDWRSGGTDDASTKRKEITSVSASTSYDVAVSYVVRGVIGARRILGPVTTSQQIAGSFVGAGALATQDNVDWQSQVTGQNKPEDGATVGATAEQQAAIADAISKAEARGRLFFRSTAPNVAESALGDTWIDGAGVFHDRVNSGGIILGGSSIVLGGYRPFIAWTPASLQPLSGVIKNNAQALSIAMAAAASLSNLDDDGILTVFEKRAVLLPNEARLQAAYTEVKAAAVQVGVSVVGLDSARNAWVSMRDSITPAYNDLTANSVAPISWQSILDAYSAAINAAISETARVSATKADWDNISGDNKPDDNADVTATAQRTIEPQYPIIEIKQYELGNSGTRYVSHNVLRGYTSIGGGTWSIENSVLGAASISINEVTGLVSLNNVTGSGSYTVKYTHTDNIVTLLTVNVTFTAQASSVRSINATPSPVSWTDGSTTTRTITHSAIEGSNTLAGGVWSIVSKSSSIEASINSATGAVTISAATDSGYITVRYAHTSGAVVDATTNLVYYSSTKPSRPINPDYQIP